jgi:hypothetical protein
LFLLVQEGREKLILLHDQLYTGILQQFLWNERAFVLHVSLGLFADQHDVADGLAPRFS